MATREERVARATELRERGLTYAQIAERMGISLSYVGDLVTDPDRSKDLARRRSYEQPCVDCGARTGGSEGRRVEPRCAPCAHKLSTVKQIVWTSEILIERIREWARIYGEPPATRDWSASGARQVHDEERARRYEDDPSWPAFKTVVYHFGSWNAAIEAAGFTPRAPHGGGGNERRRRYATPDPSSS